MLEAGLRPGGAGGVALGRDEKQEVPQQPSSFCLQPRPCLWASALPLTWSMKPCSLLTLLLFKVDLRVLLLLFINFYTTQSLHGLTRLPSSVWHQKCQLSLARWLQGEVRLSWDRSVGAPQNLRANEITQDKVSYMGQTYYPSSRVLDRFRGEWGGG